MTYQIKGLPRRYIPVLNDGQFKAIADSRAKWQYLAWHNAPPHLNSASAACRYDDLVSDSVIGSCDNCAVCGITQQAGCAGTPLEKWQVSRSPDQAEAEYLFIEGIYSIELHRRMGL